MSYPAFWASLDQAAQRSGDRELLDPLSVLTHPQDGPAPEYLVGVFSDAAARFRAAHAARLAIELGVAWPTRPDDDAIAGYCRTLLATIPEPGGDPPLAVGQVDPGCP